MKIINRKDFLRLPSGVLYAKFEEYNFDEILIKGESFENDWSYQSLLEVYTTKGSDFVETLFDALGYGNSFFLDFNCEGRDGLYNNKQLFAVFEKNDVISLIERLNQTIANYPEI